MEKIINIDGRDVKLKADGAILLRYKMQFQRDCLQDMFRLVDMKSSGVEIDYKNFDTELLYRLTWILAKTANTEIPPMMEWFESFDDFPIFEVLPDVMDIIRGCLANKKKEQIIYPNNQHKKNYKKNYKKR